MWIAKWTKAPESPVVKAVITNHPLLDNIVGMAGPLIGWFIFEGRKYYVIRAENYGPKIDGFLQWIPGNIEYVQKTSIRRYE